MNPSGTYPKPPDPRQECETLRECPCCQGAKEVRTVLEDTATTYRVSIEACTFCDGVGCVPKWRVA